MNALATGLDNKLAAEVVLVELDDAWVIHLSEKGHLILEDSLELGETHRFDFVPFNNFNRVKTACPCVLCKFHSKS